MSEELRKRIYQLAEIEVLVLISAGVLKLIVTSVLSFGSFETTILGESLNLFNLIALALISATVAIQYTTPEHNLSGKEVGSLLLLTAIIYRFLLLRGSPVRHAMFGMLAIAGLIGITSLYFGSTTVSDAGRRALYSVNIMCLVSMATAFIISYPSGGTLVILIVGGYFLLANFEDVLFNHEHWPDPIEIIYRSIISLSASSTGTIFAGLVIFALFSTLSLGPALVIVPTSADSYTNLSELSSRTNIFQIIFTVLISIYWLSLLRRLPTSVKYWKQNELNSGMRIPARPQLRHLALFLGCWVLSIFPEYISRTHRIPYTSHTNSVISTGYIIVLLFGLTLSMLSLLPISRDRISFGFESRLGSVRMDFRILVCSFLPVLFATIFGSIQHYEGSFDLIYIPLITIASASEVIDWIPSEVWVVFPLIVIFLPIFVVSKSVYWGILFFLSVGYLSMKVAESI